MDKKQKRFIIMKGDRIWDGISFTYHRHRAVLFPSRYAAKQVIKTCRFNYRSLSYDAEVVELKG